MLKCVRCLLLACCRFDSNIDFFFCYSMFQPMAMDGRRGSWTYEDALVSCFIRWAEIWECSKCIFHPMPWICIRFRWLIAKCSDSLMTAIHKFFLRRKHCLTLSNFHDFFYSLLSNLQDNGSYPWTFSNLWSGYLLYCKEKHKTQPFIRCRFPQISAYVSGS